MIVHLEPKVRLIARPTLNWEAIRSFLAEEGAGWERKDEAQAEGELLCEFMGRMCYGSFGERQGRKSTAGYIENILDQGHGSVLEHANWSFLVTACSRGFTHQMVRHRAGFAYSQESTHFVRYDADARMCLPGFKGVGQALAGTFIPLVEAVRAYEAAVEALDAELPGEANRARRKALTGTARGLLPIALESKLGFTANLRALRHFCEVRGAPENTVEIRLVAVQVVRLMREEAPTAFSDFEEFTANDGFAAMQHKWRKV